MKTNFSIANSMLKLQMNMVQSSRNKIEKLKIRQKCENCGKHIEQTAKFVNGVQKANWDKISGMLVLEFNSSKTSLKIIELAIADAGHDTPNFKGRNNYYSLMPQCCQFND
jgi:hypothetical protein